MRRMAQTLLLDHFDDYRVAGVKTLGVAPPYLNFVPARFGKGPSWEPLQASTYLEWLAEVGVRTICFHEHWSPYQSHPYVTQENRPRLHSLIEACHRAKVSLLLYMSRQLADNAPEWNLHSAEALQTPNMGVYDANRRRRRTMSAGTAPGRTFACGIWTGCWPSSGTTAGTSTDPSGRYRVPIANTAAATWPRTVQCAHLRHLRHAGLHEAAVCSHPTKEARGAARISTTRP